MEAGRKFGYIRVSTKEQNVDRQIDSLSKFVTAPRNIVIDKSSGKDFDRAAVNTLEEPKVAEETAETEPAEAAATETEAPEKAAE